ncbi:hypothetical protein ACSBR1_017512 [Camellia fascicularis]
MLVCADKQDADKQDARMFYASALSFNLAMLRTTLLAQEKAHVNRKLQRIKDSWKKKGVSICSDGWSDGQKRPLINIMAASVGGAMLVEAIDATNLVTDVHNIRNFIMNHSLPNAIFKSYSNLELLRIAETRFQSHIVMAKYLKEVKPTLEKMVIDAGWKIYKGDGKNPVDAKAREDTTIENVKAIIFEHEDKDYITRQSDFFDTIHEILEARWTKSNTPLHCIAHSLVPKYYHETWLQGGSNGIRRLAPHEDEEGSTNRSKCFEQLFQKNTTHMRNVYVEYGAFSSGSGYFNQPHVIEARMYEEPISWWANHGASTPSLQGLASSKAEDLVFVHCNIRMLSRKKKEYKEGPSKYWDLWGDRFDIDGSPIEFAELSINEPELELVTFNDAMEEVQPNDVDHDA